MTALRRQKAKSLPAEFDEMHSAVLHVEAAIKMHRSHCKNPCGLERRLLEAFDRVYQVAIEYRMAGTDAGVVLEGEEP